MKPVDPTVNDRDDQYYEELLGAAAFGTLTAAEAVELEDYLARSPAAQAELAELRALAADLPLLVDDVEPSADLRNRIEQAVLADVAWARPDATAPKMPDTDQPSGIVTLTTVPPLEEIQSGTPVRKPTPIWRSSLWAAAAALLIAVIAGVLLDRFVLDGGGDDNVQTIAYELTLSTPIPDLGAELTYDEDAQIFTLQTENMPAAPEGQVYQVWLIDTESVPQPMGVMADPTFAVAADRDNYTAFAITVEPGPIGSAGPTTPPFFVAPLN